MGDKKAIDVITHQACFLLLLFFLKALRSTRESFKILYVYVDRTQCKRDCSSSLETRHTETLTPRARAHTPTHTPQHPVGKSRVEQSSNAGPAASTPGVRANQATLGPPLAFFLIHTHHHHAYMGLQYCDH